MKGLPDRVLQDLRKVNELHERQKELIATPGYDLDEFDRIREEKRDVALALSMYMAGFFSTEVASVEVSA